MLSILRRQAQSILIQGLVLIIAIVFIFWGVGTNMTNKRNSIAVVNGEEISLQDFQRNYERTVDQYRQQFGGALPPGLLEQLGIKRQVMLQMIRAELLRQGGEAMGIRLSKLATQEAIKNMDVFHENGQFSLQRYKDLLARNRLTPSSYEKGLQRDMLVERVTNAVSSFAVVPDTEFQVWLDFLGEEIRLDYAVFKPEDYVGQVQVNQGDLVSWYEQHKEEYRLEPKVKLKYLFFPVKAGQGEETGNKSEAFKQASQAYEEIIRTGSIDKYEQLGKAKVLVTDYFSRSQPPAGEVSDPAFLEKAFRLKKGELSSLVELKNGFAILYVAGIQEAAVPELDEVRDRVVADYRKDRAADLARKAAEEFLKKAVAENGRLPSGAGVEILESGFFKRATLQAGTTPPLPVVRDAFALTARENLARSPVEVGGSYYVFAVKERRQSDKPLDGQEQEKLREQLQASAQSRLLADWLSFVQQRAKIWTNEQFLQ
ncbi:SurA N-terminal domain-containing protein [Desulfolithobacter sp.]